MFYFSLLLAVFYYPKAKHNKLGIKINSDFGLLNQFGEYLPNLRELKLNHSVIQGISDIGTNFRNLQILHICNCNLKELSGSYKLIIFRNNLFFGFTYKYIFRSLLSVKVEFIRWQFSIQIQIH